MVSEKLQRLMAGWGKNNRKTKPLNNSLMALAAASLSSNDVKYILTHYRHINRLKRLAEYRGHNLGSMRNWMREYERNVNARRRLSNIQR